MRINPALPKPRAMTSLRQLLSGRFGRAPEHPSTAIEDVPPKAPPTVIEPSGELLALLFTDLAGSTRLVDHLGDRRWAELLRWHRNNFQTTVHELGGVVVDTPGDGAFAVFASPGLAISCASWTRRVSADLGLAIRAGVHVGECERLAAGVAGINVHRAARIQQSASPGQIVVSRTVVEVVAGSELQFVSLGTVTLKGIREPHRALRRGSLTSSHPRASQRIEKT